MPTLLAFWLSASPWSSPYALSASLSTPEHSQHQHQGEILDHLESLLWNTVQPVVERPRSSAAAGTLPPWPKLGKLCALPILGECSNIMQKYSIRPVNSKLCGVVQPVAEM